MAENTGIMQLLQQIAVLLKDQNLVPVLTELVKKLGDIHTSLSLLLMNTGLMAGSLVAMSVVIPMTLRSCFKDDRKNS